MFFAEKKGNKSGELNNTMKLLASSIGGERALARKSPICAGRYNSTKANDVSSMLIWVDYTIMRLFSVQGAKLLLNISKCDGNIREACNISLSNDTSSGFDKCSRIMMDFR